MALTYRTLGKMEDSIKQLVADVNFLVDFCAGVNGYVSSEHQFNQSVVCSK